MNNKIPPRQHVRLAATAVPEAFALLRRLAAASVLLTLVGLSSTVAAAESLPTYTLEPESSSVVEGERAYFELRRTGRPAGRLRVHYRVSESGAMIRPRYAGWKSVSLPSSLRWVYLDVPTVNDGVLEARSVVTVTLEAGEGYELGSPRSATVTVEDDDNAAPTGAPTISNRTPAVGDALTADASGVVDADGLTGAIFSYQWIRVSGEGETNISGAVSATYAVVAGDVGARLKVALSYTDDDGVAERVESAETAAVTVGDDDGGADLPEVTVVRLASPVEEGADARFRLRRAGGAGSAGALRVRYRVSESGAMVASGGEGDKTVTFPDGVSDVTVTVATFDDGAHEADSVVTLRLAADAGASPAYLLGAPATAAVTVKDDDGGPQLPTYTLERESSSAVEGERAYFKLLRTGRPAGRLRVHYRVSESGAMIRPRYAGWKTISLPSSLRWVYLDVPTVNDGVLEARSVVTVTLEAGEGYELGSPRSATVTVEDDDGGADLPEVTVVRVSSSAVEGGFARFRLRRAGGAGDSGALRVRYRVSESGAMLASGGEGDKTVAFPDGVSEVRVTVATVDDGAHEADSLVTLRLAADAGADPAYLLGAPATAAVTVEDDDNAAPTGAPTISNRTPAVGDALTADASGVVDADGLTGATFSYQWIRVSGEGGTNIPGAVSATYAVVAEDVGARLKVAVSYTDDDGVAERVESAATAVVASGLSLLIADANVLEGDTGETELAFTVSVAPPATGVVTVDWATADVKAEAGTDYRAGNGTLTFNTGETEKTVAVQVRGDRVDEPNETFRVRLSNASGAELGRSLATGTIRDDDAEPRAALALSPDTIGDAGGVSVVTASLDRPSSEATTVTVSAASSLGGYALSSNRRLRIPAGETEISATSTPVTISATSTPVFVSGTSTSAIFGTGYRTVAVSGTAGNDLGVRDPQSVTLAITGPVLVPFLPPASAPGLEGFVRVLNHSDAAGEVAIEAIDDAGVSAGAVTLPIAAKAARHFNARDLEEGNPDKGFAKGVGAGQGGWRLVLRSALPITALAYVRTADEVVAPMHDAAPLVGDGGHVAFFNPASNLNQMSSLRLVNLGGQEAEVIVVGTDDAGVTPDAAASVTLPAGGASHLTAGELEAALGDGEGKWRLAVRSSEPVLAMSLLTSAAGHLTNLSTVPARPGDGGGHVVPFFPSAADAFGRQGFVRVANRSVEAGEVAISAYDDSGLAYEAVTLAIGAGATMHFNSEDLELGNAEKGLAGSTGSGLGDWRLELASGLDIEVLAYVRMSDGLLVSMHDLVPTLEGGAHWVAFFNPADNLSQSSGLRLVNPSVADAAVTIMGIDDQGASPGGVVTLTVPAGASRTLGAAELESGADGLDFADGLEGALGDGLGKWRLRIVSDQPILVMSLLTGPGGYLTNLSSAPSRGLR